MFTPTAAGTATITATSTQDSTKSGTAKVIVYNGPSPNFAVAGPTGGSIAFAEDLSTPGTMYATGYGSGIFKSLNSGKTWARIATDGPAELFASFGVAVSRNGTVYVTCNCGPHYWTVFQSTDKGGTFTDIGESFANGVYSVKTDPLNDSVLYFIDTKGTIFQSSDTGKSWTTLSPPAACSSKNILPDALKIFPDESVEGKLYFESSCSGFYMSTDFGKTWVLLNATMSFGNSFTQAPSDPTRIYDTLYSNQYPVNGGIGHVYSSSDGGATWQETSGYSMGGGIAIDPKNSDDLYVFDLNFIDSSNNFVSGVIHSTDGGASWTYVSAPTLDPSLENGSYADFIASLYWIRASSTLTSTFDGHIWQIPFDGSSWSLLEQGLTANFGYQIAVDPASPTILYMSSGNGLSKSTDGGETWKFLLDAVVESVAVDPFNPQHLLAGIPGIDQWSGGQYKAVQASEDGGATWTNSSSSSVACASTILFDAKAGGTVYAGCESGGLAKSTDGGGTWSSLTVGSTSLAQHIYGLAIDPANSQVLIAATANGVYKSRDGGQSWTLVDSSQSSSTSIAFDPNHPGVVYVSGSGLIKSIDDGNSWQTVNTGLSGNQILNVVVNSETADTIYLIASLDSIGWSPDGGTTWAWFTNVLPNVYLTVTGNFASAIPATSQPAFANNGNGVLYVPSASVGLVSWKM